jgi:hypothetical protein
LSSSNIKARLVEPKSLKSGLDVKKRLEKTPKTALGCFSQFMGEKMKEQKEVELQKLALEREKFNHTKLMEADKLRLDMFQVRFF